MQQIANIHGTFFNISPFLDLYTKAVTTQNAFLIFYEEYLITWHGNHIVTTHFIKVFTASSIHTHTHIYS